MSPGGRLAQRPHRRQDRLAPAVVVRPFPTQELRFAMYNIDAAAAYFDDLMEEVSEDTLAFGYFTSQSPLRLLCGRPTASCFAAAALPGRALMRT